MANILFLTPYYPPENGAAAVRMGDTATRLAASGHRVTVLTTLPGYPTGVVAPAYRGRLPQEEVLLGVRVIRVWSYITPRTAFVPRVLAQLSFGCLAALLAGGRIGRPDLLIVESHPLFNLLSGRWLAWRRRCPLVLAVSDLWPESAVQLGVLRNRWLIRLATCLEWSSYRRASLIWALSRGIAEHIVAAGIPRERVLLLTNGVDLSLFAPRSQAQARAELGWAQRFTVLYAGTCGLSHGLSTVVEAAAELRTYAEIQFVLLGDGVEKARLQAQAQALGLSNLLFCQQQAHERMPLVLAAADVCLVPMRRLPLFAGRLPLKMFEIMACARPFLLGAQGEARQLAVEEAGAALFSEPENAQDLARGILYLYRSPAERERLGQRGRAFVVKHHDRDRLTALLAWRLARLLPEPAPSAADPQAAGVPKGEPGPRTH
ncbi:MAG TPA: glycosyltransferase family 4 protein [Ktedonobacteraceae bacterium]|jgi:glycosyltransferase involved in cell wall biosynthesis